MALITQRQKITATNQWNGAAPTTTVVQTAETLGPGVVNAYPTDTVGGLFTFGHQRAVLLKRIRLGFADAATGTQTSWYVAIVDADGNVSRHWSGTNEAGVLITAADGVPLMVGEKVKLVSVGATGAMFADVTIADPADERAY